MIARLQAWFATRALTVALGAVIGAGAVLAWEHHAPFGLGLAQKHAEASADLTRTLADLGSMTGDRDAWRKAAERCEALRRAESASAAERVAEAADDQARTASAAFDQGYAAGRAVGRKSCTVGGTHDSSPPAGDPVGDLIDRSVRDERGDFARLWERGAYQPGGAVPAGGAGGLSG